MHSPATTNSYMYAPFIKNAYANYYLFIHALTFFSKVHSHLCHTLQLPIYREEDVVDVDWAAVKKREKIDILIGFPHWDYEQVRPYKTHHIYVHTYSLTHTPTHLPVTHTHTHLTFHSHSLPLISPFTPRILTFSSLELSACCGHSTHRRPTTLSLQIWYYMWTWPTRAPARGDHTWRLRVRLQCGKCVLGTRVLAGRNFHSFWMFSAKCLSVCLCVCMCVYVRESEKYIYF